MTLDGLLPSNTFERKLLDVLVALHTSGKPIPIQVGTAPRYDDTPLKAEVMRLEQSVADMRAQLAQVIAVLKQHEADMQQLLSMLSTHTHETIRSAAA